MFDQLKYWNIDKSLIEIAEKIYREDISHTVHNIQLTGEENQLKVINSLQSQGLGEQHFQGTTGYGYGDLGRNLIDQVIRDIMGTEAAMLRQQWVSGTHTIFTCLKALLSEGDLMLSAVGTPYETLSKVIGLTNTPPANSLLNQGVKYDEVSLTATGEVDYHQLEDKLINNKPKVLFIQKSRGYSNRKTLTSSEILKIVKLTRDCSKDTIIMLDNCYGEFVEIKEPGNVGVDLLAGSLIKNPGGGISPCGGYAAGNYDLLELVANELYAPGLDFDMGATLETNKLFIQGLYYAPMAVSNALKGAVFCASLFKELGYDVSPEPFESRGDIIQQIELNSKEKLHGFVKGVQRGGVVDNKLTPEPEYMPGYDHPVLMAAGSFIQGGSLEVSADAPLTSPYRVYFQGGLTFSHSVLASLLAANNL